MISAAQCSPGDKDAYVQLLLWSLEGSALLQGMTFKQQQVHCRQVCAVVICTQSMCAIICQEFLIQWVSCHQHRTRLVKFAPHTDAASLHSVVAGAVACRCRLLLPRHDVVPGGEPVAEAHTLVATLVSGCAFAPEMLMRARDTRQHDVQHCRKFRGCAGVLG